MPEDLIITFHINGGTNSETDTRGLADCLTDFFKTLRPVVETAINYTAKPYDSIEVTTGASGKTITLPAPISGTYQCVEVAKVDGGAGDVTVDTIGSEQIEGSDTDVLSGQWAKQRYINNGDSWLKF